MSETPHSRDEIKAELSDTVRKLTAIRRDLSIARSQAAAKNRFIPVTQYQNMVAREADLKSKVIDLESQLRSMPKSAEKMPLSVAFMLEAEKYLDPVDFENIRYLAKVNTERVTNE